MREARAPMHPTTDDERSNNQQECCVCHDVSPVTQTNYTLISPKHQWRMEVRMGQNGVKEPLWYCPSCWEIIKQSRAGSSKKPHAPR